MQSNFEKQFKLVKPMKERTFSPTVVHHGHNIKRLREILHVKQDVLAAAFNITQQAVSELEKKAQISDELLKKVSNVLKIPVEAIKNFNDEIAIKVIVNAFND